MALVENDPQKGLQSSFRPSASKQALVVIDFTDFYVRDMQSEGLSTFASLDLEKALTATRYVSEKLRAHAPGIEQIWIADNAERMDEEKFYGQSPQDIFAKYAPLGQSIDDAVFLKPRHDAFDGGERLGHGGPLGDYLKERGINSLLIAGTTISQCVRKTAMAAIGEGLDVKVMHECVTGGISDHSKRGKISALQEFWDYGIDLASTFDILGKLHIDSEPLQEGLAKIDERMPKPKTLRQKLAGLFMGEPA